MTKILYLPVGNYITYSSNVDWQSRDILHRSAYIEEADDHNNLENIFNDTSLSDKEKLKNFISYIDEAYNTQFKWLNEFIYPVLVEHFEIVNNSYLLGEDNDNTTE